MYLTKSVNIVKDPFESNEFIAGNDDAAGVDGIVAGDETAVERRTMLLIDTEVL
jgi:hypothetical protein